jgi:Mg2+ and Co2+ transporter CorA
MNAIGSAWLHRLLKLLGALLTETLMGLLAIGALGASLLPELFDVSDRVAAHLDAAERAIVAVFVAEYVVHFLLAPNKKEYVCNGWRLLDLFTIAAATLSLLPQVADALRQTLILRLLRIARSFTFGARAGTARYRLLAADSPAPVATTPRAFVVGREPSWPTHALDWKEFLLRISGTEGAWHDAFDVAGAQAAEMARALGVPVGHISLGATTHTYPRIKRIGNLVAAVVWLPFVRSGDQSEIDWCGILAILREDGSLLTAAARDCQLQQRMARWMDPRSSDSVAAQGAEAFFRMVLEQTEEAVAALENRLRTMEGAPVAAVGEDFFRQAFRLRRDVFQISADLWRLKAGIDQIEAGRIQLPRPSPQSAEVFGILSEQADYLYETADNLREGLVSLIELHLNTVSYEMNRFMRLLAMVSVLGLVPATVGGLLGMNILGNPWPVTLGQVTFFVGLVVLAILYVFMTRGNLQ